MNFRVSTETKSRVAEAGSILIIVLWIAFGLVSISLYLGNSMGLELRASDNRVAAIEAEEAIAGAALYASNVLANYATNGAVPADGTFRAQEVPVGDARIWFIGRDKRKLSGVIEPAWGFVDEGGKLNLNTARAASLQLLPRMTVGFAAAIVDWRDADSQVSPSGAEDESYSRQTPAYRCKNGNFESIEELRLVSGANMELLYGEDANLNGVLDPNENDAETAPPSDNRDSRLDAGLLEYVTCWSRESNRMPDGSSKTNVNNAGQRRALLTQKFGAEIAQAVGRRMPSNVTVSSELEFYDRSRLSREQFDQIADFITFTNGAVLSGRINVNTASEEVLACVPGLDEASASALVAYRVANPDKIGSIAWVKEALQSSAFNANIGRFLTTRSYQFTADIAAVGHHGRGFKRIKYVFDLSEGAPRIIYRQDLTHLGWALGRDAKQLLLAQGNKR